MAITTRCSRPWSASSRKGPYLLGERFSAADVLWGTALGWTTMFKLVPKLPEIMDYVKRVGSPPRRRPRPGPGTPSSPPRKEAKA